MRQGSPDHPMTMANTPHTEPRIEPFDGNVTPAMMRLLLTADPNEALVRGYLGDAKVLLCYADDAIAGIAVVIKHAEPAPNALAEHCSPTCELINIAVDTAYQGKGLAKAMIARCIDIARGWQAHALEVGTGNSSLDQLALYQKCGFRMHRIERGFFAAYPEPIIENGVQCLDKVVLRMALEEHT